MAGKPHVPSCRALRDNPMPATSDAQLTRAGHHRGPTQNTTHMMEGMGNNLNLTCKAVLFDMDGTLVDSGVVVERARGRWAARHGIPLETVLLFSHGRDFFQEPLPKADV